jgi:hypothetical protein
MIEITDEWITKHDVEDGPVLQARVNAGDTVLHLQGYGEEQNRPYGYAEKFYVPLEMTEWLRNKTATHMSFASPTEAYIRGVCVVQYADGVQLLIDGEGGNHTQGTHFVLDMNTDSSRVKQLLDFVNNNDLLTTMNSTRWVEE